MFRKPVNPPRVGRLTLWGVVCELARCFDNHPRPANRPKFGSATEITLGHFARVAGGTHRLHSPLVRQAKADERGNVVSRAG